MKTFTIWLGNPMPADYAACVASVVKQHPDHRIITEWPKELDKYRTGNVRHDSDILRVYCLAFYVYCEFYADADSKKDSPFDEPPPDKLAFANSGMTGIPDWWLMGGSKEIARELFEFGISVNFERGWINKWLANSQEKVYLYNTIYIKHGMFSNNKS